MTKIAELKDKGAVVAWSPLVGEYADVIALGSKEKGGIGFDDYGGELELYDWNITQTAHNDNDDSTLLPEPTLLGSIKTTTRFGSLAWSKGSGGDLNSSILAGGMLDGTVNLWKPSSLLTGASDEDALLASVQKHQNGGVSSMKFNPHSDSANLLATGGSSGQVWMISAEGGIVNTYSPSGDDTNGCNLGGEVTQVAWNSQVSHILASSSTNGTVVVWDLRQKKPWCELRVESNSSVSDVAWNPTQGLHMMTASGSGSMKLWDLRSSTSMPLTTLEGGHAGGVLSMDWCPHDDTLLISCGNDSRTLLWDLYSLRPIAEIPNDESSGVDQNQMHNQQQQQPSDFYGGGLGSSQQKRYDVSWSPIRRGVVSTCSFDRKVQAHSVIGLATKCGRPPKWMSPSSGVSCGFGGTVVSIDNSQQQRTVTIDNVVEHPELVAVSEKFESNFIAGSTDYITYCHDMASRATDAYERQVWSFMQIMFETNAREELLSYLGFDPDKIQKTAMEFNEGENGENGSSIKSSLPTPPPPPGSESDASREVGGTPAMSKRAENAVKDALLVGNFEAAVECCFRSGNLADALVLASCGGADLWQKTQAEYFARESKRRPFLTLVSAVVHDQLTDLVAMSDPKKWKETLAVLSTYGKSEEFPLLCAALGDRLEEAKDFANASLCYMCALNLGQAVGYWKFALQKSNNSDGITNLLSLQDFIEKVTVFTQALDSSQVQLDDDVANIFADYSNELASQGLLVAAAKYLEGCNTQECNELRDRIYRSRMGRFCPGLMASPPDFPYDFVNVGVARDLEGITVKQSGGQLQQQQQLQEQQFAAQPDTTNYDQSQQQQQQVQQSPQLQPTQPEQANAGPPLLPGWLAVQDPTSGQTYYANQSTGEASWEPPLAPAPQPAPAATSYEAQPAPNPAQQLQQQQQPTAQNGAATRGNTTSQKVASKYGDGFVTSASNPQLAEQYGNVGTSNPYTNANRPGTAAAAVGGATQKAPVSATLDPNSMPALSQEYAYLQDGLMAIVERLAASATGAMEKKQAIESQKAVAVFIKTLARGRVDADVANKVGNVLTALQNRDYSSASSVVTSLVSNEWKDHKDWLKGMKIMVQVCTKKQM